MGVNTTVPLPAPTLSPKEPSVILMLQLMLLDTPAPTTPLILLDIPAPTTPLILDIPLCITPLILDILTPTTLDIPPSTRLPSTTKLKFKHAKLSQDPLFKRHKSLGKQPQLKNRFFPKELQLPKENTS